MAKLQRRRTRRQQLRVNNKFKKSILKDKLIDICCYCNKAFLVENLTVEHVVPLSWGGTNDISNIDLACAPCNQQRGRESWLMKRDVMKLQHSHIQL